MSRDIETGIVKRVEWEPEHDKRGMARAVSELVTEKVDHVHLERMRDDHFWMSLDRGEERQLVIFRVTNKGKLVVRTQPG